MYTIIYERNKRSQMLIYSEIWVSNPKILCSQMLVFTSGFKKLLCSQTLVFTLILDSRKYCVHKFFLQLVHLSTLGINISWVGEVCVTLDTTSLTSLVDNHWSFAEIRVNSSFLKAQSIFLLEGITILPNTHTAGCVQQRCKRILIILQTKFQSNK